MADEPNDIQATGRCCCAGCTGMGPCDLDPPQALGGADWDADNWDPDYDLDLCQPGPADYRPTETIQPAGEYL